MVFEKDNSLGQEIQVSVKVDGETKERLMELCMKRRINQSNLLRYCINRFLEEELDGIK